MDVGALSGLFRNKATSYKYVFFLGLIRCLERRRDQPAPRVPLREIVVELLALAWYPHTFFRLSFGAQDRLGVILDHVSARIGQQQLDYSSADVARLRTGIDAALSAKQLDQLTRYVPYRLLEPFFPGLAGPSDSQKNQRIEELARSEFETRKPLYRIEADALVVHPDWATYLRENRKVIDGWASWHWLSYMQARNPNVPSLAGKLFPVVSRRRLTRQTEYWKAALRAAPLHCIYSGEPLARIEALDHYVPWSFVLHDRIWNLVPVTARANSSKGERLAAGIYLDRLIDLQCRGLIAARAHLDKPMWERFAEELEQDLRVPSEILRATPIDREALRRSLDDAYRKTIPALESLAARQGFPSGWVYRSG